MRDLQSDLEICNGASPGPWEVITEYMDEPGYEQYIKSQEIVRRFEDGVAHVIARINWSCPVEANAHLIAAAREGWPEAIKRAMKAEAELEVANQRWDANEERCWYRRDKNCLGMEDKCPEDCKYNELAKAEAENTKLQADTESLLQELWFAEMSVEDSAMRAAHIREENERLKGERGSKELLKQLFAEPCKMPHSYCSYHRGIYMALGGDPK